MAIRWFGPQVGDKIKDKVGSRLQAATIYLHKKTRQLLSRKQPTRGVGTRKYGLKPSKPGEPYKRVTGSFIRAVRWEYNSNLRIGRVGTNDPRGKWGELGTRKMARRPWLSTALLRERRTLGTIIGTGVIPK